MLLQHGESLRGRNQNPTYGQNRRTTFARVVATSVPIKGIPGPSSVSDGAVLALKVPRFTALPWLTAPTNLSSVADHPLPIARRMPDSHTHPCKERGSRSGIDTVQVETLPCVLERSRQDQRIRSLLYSEAGLPRSDRGSQPYSYDSLCRKTIIRLRLLLIQWRTLTAHRDHRERKVSPQDAFRVDGVETVWPGKMAIKLSRDTHG